MVKLIFNPSEKNNEVNVVVVESLVSKTKEYKLSPFLQEQIFFSRNQKKSIKTRNKMSE